MSSLLAVPETIAALTADGTAQGIVTVASTTNFKVGARCALCNANAVLQMDVVILAIPSATTLAVRQVGQLLTDAATKVGYTYTDVSTFLAADTSKIHQPKQYVSVEATPTVTQVIQ